MRIESGAPCPAVAGFYEASSGSVQYVVSDPGTRRCAIIDPVLNYDEKSGSTATRSADELLAHVRGHGLEVEWILDTHPHADHFTAADYLRQRTGAPIAIGEKIVEVQSLWKRIYNLPASFPADGRQWDRLLADGDRVRVGGLDLQVMLCPGHTLCSVTYLVGDAAFIHDTLFMPDSGTARADFPGADPAALWNSIQRILSLPGTMRLFTGHDYRPGSRPAAWQSTVAEQRACNKHLLTAASEAEFVALRTARDRTLPMPRLILHAMQININAGRLPAPEANGQRYLRLPLHAFGDVPWD